MSSLPTEMGQMAGAQVRILRLKCRLRVDGLATQEDPEELCGLSNSVHSSSCGLGWADRRAVFIIPSFPSLCPCVFPFFKGSSWPKTSQEYSEREYARGSATRKCTEGEGKSLAHFTHALQSRRRLFSGAQISTLFTITVLFSVSCWCQCVSGVNYVSF